MSRKGQRGPYHHWERRGGYLTEVCRDCGMVRRRSVCGGPGAGPTADYQDRNGKRLGRQGKDFKRVPPCDGGRERNYE